jgi:hypothetical protein
LSNFDYNFEEFPCAAGYNINTLRVEIIQNLIQNFTGTLVVPDETGTKV